MGAPAAVNKAIQWGMRQLQKRVPYNARNPFLEGVYAPLKDEYTETDLVVEGEIPAGLNGVLARIGPNPLQVENPAIYNWFLGDGMVHGLKLQNGRALWYRNRYVGVDSVNATLGRPTAPGPRRGVGDVVNTNIIGHAGQLWALVEAGSLPVALDGEFNTVRHGLFNSSTQRAFSAHPHQDPDTGDLHAVCYDAPVRDKVRYLCIGKDGELKRDVAIPVQHGPMIHDCAITQSKVIILDLPVTFSVARVLKGSGLPYAWNARHQARVGVLPRNGGSADVRWYPIDPCFVFHTCNAYDLDNGDIMLDVVVHARVFEHSTQGPLENQPITFERWTLENATGRVRRQVISREPQEFPRLDERLTSKPYRYAYAITVNPDAGQPVANSLLRHDLQSGETLRHDYGEGWSSGEVVFVPRSAAAKEDEGWLLSYVHDVQGGHSKVVILDAQKLGQPPQAEIKLPVRVPLGFHGNWIADQK